MSGAAAETERPAGRRQPLVAVVSSVPMIFEALRDTLGLFADVQSLPAQDGTVGFLRSIRPAAVVVDDEAVLAEARDAAEELGFLLVHLSLADGRVRVFRDGAWAAVDEGDGLRPETVRDVVAAGVFSRDET